MDTDDISLPNRLKKQIAFLETNPNYSLVGTSALVINENNNEIDTWILSTSNIKSRLFFSNYFVHTSVCIKASVIKEFLYNEKYLHAEDYFLWSQIALKYKVANIKEPLVKYRVHSESISQTKLDQQENTVKETFSFHLSNIGINNLSVKQKELHYKILRNKTGFGFKSNESVEVLKWLNFLLKQNEKYRVYDSKFFKEKLEVFWNKHFSMQKSFMLGVKAIPLIFTKFVNISKKQKLFFILRCIKYSKHIHFLLKL